MDRANWGRVRRVTAAVLAAVAVLAACEPMPHTTFTQRAAPGGGADLALVAGNGGFVVLTATAAGPVVPGAGNWRVDRTTGDAVALPDGTPQRISADGTRVLVGTMLWDDGTTAAAPSGVLSDDLSARAFVDGDGSVHTQDLATGTVRPVEPGFPRPPGSAATVLGVSDDGDVVAYRFDSTIRVVDLGASASFDITSLAGPGTTEEVLLAASGTTLAHVVDTIGCVPEGCQIFSSTIDWIQVPTGAVLGHYDNLTQEQRRFTRIAANGRAVWSYQERGVSDDSGHPSCPSAPFFAICIVEASLVEISDLGVTVDAVGPGAGVELTASGNGRFAALSRQQPGYRGLMPAAPVRVVDRLSSGPRWETLTGSPTPSTRAQITHHGQLIATTSGTGGWYEFEA